MQKYCVSVDAAEFCSLRNRDDSSDHEFLMKTYASCILEIYEQFAIAISDILHLYKDTSEKHQGIIEQCVLSQYPLAGILQGGAYGAEYPNCNWSDFWEIITQYFYPSLDISYEKRKKKAQAKAEKLIKDAETAEAEGRSRLAKNIRERKPRPQNWKKTIKTMQVGACAMEFTAALNHFIAANSRKLGLEGLEWKWLSLCSDHNILISVDEVSTRVNDIRAQKGQKFKPVNFKERRESNNRYNIGLFTEGDDYADKYIQGGYMARAKKYNGAYVDSLMGKPESMVIMRKEYSHLEEALLVPICGSDDTGILLPTIRSVFSEAKVRGFNDANMIFVIGAAGESGNAAYTWILRSIVGLHKHATVIARLPIMLNSAGLSILYLMARAFSNCEIVSPSTGGSMYVIAEDFKKNICKAHENIILDYMAVLNNSVGLHPQPIFIPESADEKKLFGEFAEKAKTACSAIIAREMVMMKSVVDAVEGALAYSYHKTTGNVSQKELFEVAGAHFEKKNVQFANKWINKFKPSELPEGKALLEA